MVFASETDKHWNRGYVSGSFDLFHIGHLNLLRRAKERSDYLVVGVLTDECIETGKNKRPVITLRDRMEIVAAVKYVDEVDITTGALLNKVTAWEKYHFNAMFSGDDHAYDGWAGEDEALESLGAELVFFPYTKNVSSTLIQERVLPRKTEAFTHLFPFDKVRNGERIIIYGTGAIGTQFARQLAAVDYCRVVAYCDTYAASGATFEGKPLFSPDILQDECESFDRIVIASTKYYDQISGQLRILGIPAARVV